MCIVLKVIFLSQQFIFSADTEMWNARKQWEWCVCRQKIQNDKTLWTPAEHSYVSFECRQTPRSDTTIYESVFHRSGRVPPKLRQIAFVIMCTIASRLIICSRFLLAASPKANVYYVVVLVPSVKWMHRGCNISRFIFPFRTTYNPNSASV